MEHTLHLTNKLVVSGVKKIDSYSKTKIVLILDKQTLVIEGNDFELGKLDTTGGVVEASGTIRTLRYQNGIINSRLFDKLTK